MKHIKLFFATGLYSGYIPFMPGTFGTLVGLLFVFAEWMIFGHRAMYANAALLLLILYPAVRVSGFAETHFGVKDPQQVVIDEVVGVWVALLFHPINAFTMIAAFFLFRFFDILKPYPVSRFENFRGGFGVVADDFVAGIYSNLVLIILSAVLSRFGLVFA